MVSFANSINLFDSCPDFQAVTTEGQEINLSDFRGEKNVILEFGSITCPYCVDAVSSMDQLYRDYIIHGFESAFVYTEESHPGENFPEHISFDQKMYCAREFKRLYNVSRPIWVDSFEGYAHRLFGYKPNMSWIIDRSGHVVFKANWTDASVIREVIENLHMMDEKKSAGIDLAYFFAERVYYRQNDIKMYIEGLRRNGPKALFDVGLKYINNIRSHHEKK